MFYANNSPKIFIRPRSYNEHVTFHNFMLKVRNIPGELKGANLFFVEDVGYQKAAIQVLAITRKRSFLNARRTGVPGDAA